MAIRGEQIVAAGTEAEIRELATPSTTVVDLGGKTLLPGLYAAHDHFAGAGTVALYRVDLNSPPIGAMSYIEDVVAVLKNTPTDIRSLTVLETLVGPERSGGACDSPAASGQANRLPHPVAPRFLLGYS